MKAIHNIITQIPPEQRATVNFTHYIDKIPFEFIIQFSAFGEVLEVESTYFQLPPMAQKMMVNAQQRLLLQNFMDVLPLIVPLAMRREFRGEEWQIFADEYERLTAKVPYVWKPYGRKRINEEWLDAVFNMTESWGYVVEYLLRYEKSEIAKGLNMLNSNLATEPCLRFVIQYLPTLMHYELERGAIHVLKRHRIPESIAVFLTISKKAPVGDSIQTACLQGLHHFRTPEIEDYLLERYINKPNPRLNGSIIAELVKTTEEYQHPNFTKYLFAIIEAGLYNSSKAAIILRKKGVTPKEIYQFIYPFFKNNKSQAHVNNVLKICHQLGDRKLRPSLDEVIDKIEFQGFYVNIKQLYPRLTRPAFDRLLKLSYSDDTKSRHMVMGQLMELSGKDYTPHLLKRFEKESEGVKINILQNLLYTIKRIDATHLLSWFLKAKEDNNQTVRLLCMRCINVMYQNKVIKPSIYDTLIKDIKRNDIGNHVKSQMLSMLSWYPTEETKSILKSFYNSSNRELKNAASRALQKIKYQEERDNKIVQMKKPNQPTYHKHDYNYSSLLPDQLIGLVAIILMGWLVRILWSIISS